MDQSVCFECFVGDEFLNGKQVVSFSTLEKHMAPLGNVEFERFI